MSPLQIPYALPVPTPAARPGCPAWCTHPHPEDESHFGPSVDVEALSAKGTPLLVAIDCDYDGVDLVTLAMRAPGWRLQGGEVVVFTLDQIADIRDVFDAFLTLTGHPAARPQTAKAG